jgi:hypothetical protein
MLITSPPAVAMRALSTAIAMIYRDLAPSERSDNLAAKPALQHARRIDREAASAIVATLFLREIFTAFEPSERESILRKTTHYRTSTTYHHG